MEYTYPVVVKEKYNPRLLILMVSNTKGIVVNIPKEDEVPYALFEVVSFKSGVEYSDHFSKDSSEPEYYFTRLHKHLNNSLKSIQIITTLFRAK